MIFATNQVRHVMVADNGANITFEPKGNDYVATQMEDTTFISRSDLINKDNIISVTKDTSKTPFLIYHWESNNLSPDELISNLKFIKLKIYDSPGSTNPMFHNIPCNITLEQGIYTIDELSKKFLQNLGLTVKVGGNGGLNPPKPCTIYIYQGTLTSTKNGQSGVVYFEVDFADKDLNSIVTKENPINKKTAKWFNDYYDEYLVLGDGYTVVELEKFCNSFKSNSNFGTGYPYSSTPIKTYADVNSEYTMYNIHYAYVGSGENPQKSEKDLTLCFKSAPGSESDIVKLYNEVNGITSDTTTNP